MFTRQRYQTNTSVSLYGLTCLQCYFIGVNLSSKKAGKAPPSFLKMTVEVVDNETIKVKPCVFQENANYEKGLDGLLGIFKFFLFTYFQYLFIYLFINLIVKNNCTH